MAISQQSVNRIADSLTEDFSVFLQCERFDEISELLASAADEFIGRELGDLDEQLYVDLVYALMQRVTVA